jgi:eukaryotic-like serine/threonine-protein kinase
MQTMQQLGRYEILAELGRGAMGAVFRARDPRIDRIVAIKTIAVAGAGAGSLEEYRERFFREAQAAGRLSHPGIVTIFDVGEDQPTLTPFIVMEFADGMPLDEFVATAGSLPYDQALDIVQQIAEALNYAHAAGIVHRDIKPANIIVSAEGRLKIADFGIAKITLTEATLPGQIMGTPAYMSPEQINGKAVDGRSDLFSLGVIAYWLLTGVKPFIGDTVTAICVQVAIREPDRASHVNAALSDDCDFVLGRVLAKDPAMRYQRGKDLAADIQDLRAGKPVRSRNEANVSSSAGFENTLALPPEIGKSVDNATKDKARFSAATGLKSMAAPAGRRTRRLITFTWVALLLLTVTVAGVFALGANRALPATLQIVGQYPFHTAQIYIWVDGDLRYHDEVHGALHSHSKISHATAAGGGAIALTLPVRAGGHMVRVQVDAEGEIYDHDTAIPGQFNAYSQKTLRVNFNSKNLELQWE